jgi:hypothetical protein
VKYMKFYFQIRFLELVVILILSVVHYNSVMPLEDSFYKSISELFFVLIMLTVSGYIFYTLLIFFLIKSNINKKIYIFINSVNPFYPIIVLSGFNFYYVLNFFQIIINISSMVLAIAINFTYARIVWNAKVSSLR